MNTGCTSGRGALPVGAVRGAVEGVIGPKLSRGG